MGKFPSILFASGLAAATPACGPLEDLPADLGMTRKNTAVAQDPDSSENGKSLEVNAVRVFPHDDGTIDFVVSGTFDGVGAISLDVDACTQTDVDGGGHCDDLNGGELSLDRNGAFAYRKRDVDVSRMGAPEALQYYVQVLVDGVVRFEEIYGDTGISEEPPAPEIPME